MRSWQKKHLKGFSTLEYMMLIIILLAAMVGFRYYIKNAMQGQYRKVGESFAFGRQYGASATLECVYDDQINAWYAQACFSNEVLVQKCKSAANYKACAGNVMISCSNGCK